MKTLFDEPEIQTISQLTAQIKGILENGFFSVWVVGEISSLTRASSGHVYLTLKDKQATLRSVIWRTTALRLREKFAEGMEVVARGNLSVYPPRGEYQFVIEEIHQKGVGAQDLALRALKEKLARLGYFAAERKRPLARFPRRLALVTSPAGAAVRDMLEILARRWPAAEIWICPVRVQGPGAAEDIAFTLRRLNQFPAIDTILLGRGGGSAEDLAAFNHELVAHAIFASVIPIVSAVGHEIDVTLADLVADKRALTPSEAAELATPDGDELHKVLANCHQRLRDLLTARFASARQRLNDFAQRRVLQQPLERLRDHERRLDDLDTRQRRAMNQRLDSCRRRTDAHATHLQSLSPLNVLARGYSLTRTLPGQHVIRDAAEVKPGDMIEILLANGKLNAKVENCS